jgi:hypothetical protein
MSNHTPDYMWDYTWYVQGCKRLDWHPVEAVVFVEKYKRLQDALTAIRTLQDEIAKSGNVKALTIKLGPQMRRLRRTERMLGHLQTAVLTGLGKQGGGDPGNSGWLDRLRPRPSPRRGTDAVSMQEIAAREDRRFELADAMANKR